MIHWPFILGAYALTLAATAALILASFAAMRRAERSVDNMARPRREP